MLEYDLTVSVLLGMLVRLKHKPGAIGYVCQSTDKHVMLLDGTWPWRSA